MPETNLDRICPVIIARDAERTIAATLASLRPFREVLVYENGSVDDTLEICARFENVRVVRGAFLGFGPTKNHAASLAARPWVLSVDADECVDAELLERLGSLDLRDARKAYAIQRQNLLLGRHIHRGGWGNNWLVRLYHREACQFSAARVHEKVVVPKGVSTLRVEGALWHQAVTDIDQFLQKISLYTELRRGEGTRVRSLPATLLGAYWAFFRSYVIQRGFLDGWRGLLIAHCDAEGSFFKHMKRYVDDRERSYVVPRAEPWPPTTVATATTSRASALPGGEGESHCHR